MIFIDTGPLYALAVAWDSEHGRAKEWFDSEHSELVTTDYVVDELLTLIRAHADHRSALKIGSAIFRGELAHIEWVTMGDIDQAWNTFCKFDDKDWSFTDCVSRVIIERMGIPYAFTTGRESSTPRSEHRESAFDKHFQQFGNVIVIT